MTRIIDEGRGRATAWLVFSTLVLSLPLVACDCGGGSGGKNDGGVILDPCESPNPPASCGAECENHDECGNGTYCGSDSKCTADCAPVGATCDDEGRVCDAYGRCQLTSGDGGFDTDACIDVDLEPERIVPNVVLLVDKSGSMQADDIPMGDGATLRRWNALRELLIGRCQSPKRDPDTQHNSRRCSECTALVPGSVGIVGRTHEVVNYGLMIYPGTSTTSTCTARITQPIAPLNYGPIRDSFMATRCSGGTPTREAFQDVMNSLYNPADPNPTIVILATDGAPNNCSCTGGFSGTSGCSPCCNADRPIEEAAVVQAVSNAYQNDGVATYVIAISNDVAGNAHFQHVANAGQGLDPVTGNAKLYEASAGAALEAALQEIISSYIPCEIDLHATVAAADICKGTVVLDGNTLECNGDDGYERVDDRHIRLKGDACTIWKTDPEATLEATWPCGFVIIIPG
jgi:hypothetical protein